MNKKDAYEILGVDKTSSDANIKNKYNFLLVKHKAGHDVDIDLVNEAYDCIMGYNQYEKLDEKSKSFKIRKWLFNYLSLTIIVTVIVVVFVLIIYPFFNKIEYDLSVTYVGRYSLRDNELMMELLEERVEASEKHIVENIYITGSADMVEEIEQDEAGRGKIAGLIGAHDADLFIVDDDTFIFLLKNDVLVPLEKYLDDFNIEIDPDDLIYGIDILDGEKKVFAVDVSTNPLVTTTAIGSNIKMMTLIINSENRVNALRAFEVLYREKYDFTIGYVGDFEKKENTLLMETLDNFEESGIYKAYEEYFKLSIEKDSNNLYQLLDESEIDILIQDENTYKIMLSSGQLKDITNSEYINGLDESILVMENGLVYGIIVNDTIVSIAKGSEQEYELKYALKSIIDMEGSK